MADLINFGDTTVVPGEFVTHIDIAGKYVVEKTGDGIFGLWGPFPDAESAQGKPPFGRLRVEGTKWGCRILTPGFYFIRCDGSTGNFKMRHWQLSDYVIGKLHGM